MSERTLKNFAQWYEKLSGKKLSYFQLQRVSKKFNVQNVVKNK